MRQRSTSIDSVLQVFGGLMIVFGILAAAYNWPSGPGIPQGVRSLMISTAFGLGFSGVLSGFVLIGFGTVVRLLDEIRAQGDGTKTRGGMGMSAGYVDDSETTAEATGTLEVEGKKFSTVAEADAYRDLLNMIRR